MEIFSNRLATFETSHPSKRRSSGASVGFDTSWPHARPTPEELADAGFYHAPTALSPDNTACFLCQRALDGWEEEDDPITEHLRLSQGCGWAIMMDIARRSSDPGSIEDPTSARVTEARRATFRGWPHDGKRGWTCKSDKMVEAGWYYCPMEESEDFVSCPYCKLSLDGWEPKDDPFDEHYRRSDDCSFFQFAVKKPARGGRTKKGRSTKASSSTSSHTTSSAPPAPAATEVEVPADENQPTNATSKKSRTTKKGTKTKPKSSRSKKAPVPEPEIEVETTQESIDQEPQQWEPPTDYPSKKRSSDAMEEDLPNIDSITSKSRDTPASRSAKRTKKSDDERRMMYMDRVEIETYDDSKAPARHELRGKSKTPVRQQLADKPEEDAYMQTEVKRNSKKHATEVNSEPQKTSPSTVDIPDIDAAMQAVVDTLAQSLSQETLSDVSDHQEHEPSHRSTPEISQDEVASQDSPRHDNVSPYATRESPVADDRAVPSADHDAERSQSPGTYDDQMRSPRQDALTTIPSKIQNSAREHEEVEERDDDYSMVDADNGADDQQQVNDSHEPLSDHEHDMDRLSPIKPTKSSSSRNSEKSFREMADIVMSNSLNESVRERDVSESEQEEEEYAEEEPEEEPRQMEEDEEEEYAGEEPKEEQQRTEEEEEAANQMPSARTSPPATSTNNILNDAGRKAVESADVGHGGEPSLRPTRPSPGYPVERSHQESNALQQSPEKSKMSNLRANARVPEQMSDIENQPPISKTPSHDRQQAQTPLQSRVTQPVLPTRTPTNTSAHTSVAVRLKTTRPWTEVDIDEALLPKSDEDDDELLEFLDAKRELTAEEKEMTVEEWIKYTARKAEDRLKGECERLIGVFESEGGRAMRTLEGIDCSE